MSNPQHPKRPFGVTAIVILQLITISFVIIYILVLLVATGLLDIPFLKALKPLRYRPGATLMGS